MAAHQGVLSIKSPKTFIFSAKNSYIFNNRRLISLVLFGMRFKSSKRSRGNSFSSSIDRDYERPIRGHVDVYYNTLRENSQRLRKLRNDYFCRASQAYSRGQRGLAHILSQKGRFMDAAFKHSEMQTSVKILDMVNSEYRNRVPSCSRTLNVHGLHVREAIAAVRSFLHYNRDQNGRLTIITGWGRNSYPGQVRLLPALKTYLEEHGKRFEEVRPGVIEVVS